jgi:hypothetical protein
MKITERIKTFDDIINILGVNDIDVIHYYKLLSDKNTKKYDIAEYGIILIAKVLNEGWEPDWNNSNEYKCHNWFKYDSSVSRFVFGGTGCGTWHTGTLGGSRLCFREKSLGTFAANLFSDFYNDYYTKLYNKNKRRYREYYVRGELKKIEYYLVD